MFNDKEGRRDEGNRIIEKLIRGKKEGIRGARKGERGRVRGSYGGGT